MKPGEPLGPLRSGTRAWLVIKAQAQILVLASEAMSPRCEMNSSRSSQSSEIRRFSNSLGSHDAVFSGRLGALPCPSKPNVTA
jgi:hypothetical protein